MTRRPSTDARDVRIVARLREGATAGTIAREFDLTPSSSANLCTRLRREHAIKAPVGRPGRKKIDKEHRSALAEVQARLGADFVARRISDQGASSLDDGQVLEVLRLHAALRFILLDAWLLVPAVRARLREIDRERLDTLALNQADGDAGASYGKVHRPGGRQA